MDNANDIHAPQTFHLTNNTVRAHLITFLSRLECDGKWLVEVKKAEDRRSLAQNRLYWKWLRGLEAQTGFTADELHHGNDDGYPAGFKRSFMTRIYLADPVGRAQQDWVKAYNKVREFGDHDATRIAAGTVHTSWATVDQFRDYLQMIETWCISHDMQLPASVDYQDALVANGEGETRP